MKKLHAMMFGVDNVEKITNTLVDFLAYVDSFYNEKNGIYPIKGLTNSMIINATQKYITSQTKDYTWGDGDSVDRERVRDIILADAYSTSEQIRGEGDAEAASIYASAFTRDKEFYKFYRSMAAYKRTFAEKSDILLLDPNSDFFKYLNDSQSLKN